ncbi:MAG: hypothetical protein LBN36_04490, partial [Clostridiales Family XIII bacterium]|nr:hypothetical protein [Clostridiales Family XIII bacterium]
MSVRVKLGAYRYVMDMILRLKIPKPRTRWSATADTDSGIEHSLSDLTERLHPGVIRTRIVGMKQSLSDVRTFTLSPEAGYILPCFQAGQYASVKFMIDDHAVTRPYIISSAPTDAAKDNVIELTIQKREGGYVSEYIWENWKKGVVVRIDAPFGQGFYNGIRDADHIVGIASGIGSAYFRSIIREM